MLFRRETETAALNRIRGEMQTFEQNDAPVSIQTPQTYRVLLVSRNELVTFSLENFFKNTHIILTSASQRAGGIAALERDKFDAVITDICEGLDEGLRLRQDIRQTNAKLPILFLTPLFSWSDVRLLNQIAEDPYSYSIPENADRKFILARLHQVIAAYEAENSLSLMKNQIAQNWSLANQLQQAMLPPWVYFCPNYEFSCLYRPFTKVSGDLFEWLPLDEDRALFVFGDVSGHGTHSALAMTAIQSFLKQVIMLDKDRAAHPSRIAEDINYFFCNHLHSIVYMSTMVAFIDFRKNILRYQNSGYLDILCIDSLTGEVLDINPEKKGSLPLGLVKDTVYTDADDVEYHFQDSAVFLFCSDGLQDLSRDKEGRHGMDMEMCKRLASILTRDAQKEDKSIALPFRCVHSLEQFGYAHHQDDLSMVLIRKPQLNEHEYIFSCRVPADKRAADEICQQASQFVSNFYHDEALSVSTDLLLEEYLVNVIMHGLNEYEKINEYIAIELCAYEQELKLIIWDHGKEWNGLFMTPEKADRSMDQLNETLSISGRGIPIISKIASQISRQRYCGLNETIFIIPRPGTGEKEKAEA